MVETVVWMLFVGGNKGKLFGDPELRNQLYSRELSSVKGHMFRSLDI